MTGEPGGRLPMPPADPGMRLQALYEFHRDLCQWRHAATPEGHSGEALCWKALRAMDRAVGDLDDLMDRLQGGTAATRRRIAADRARAARMLEALGQTRPAIEGEIARELP